MEQANATYYKRDFWAKENLSYVRPHFRLEKAARIVNRIAGNRACELLDVGCGPATLMHLLPSNVRYFGVDIAIHNPAHYLAQVDFLENPIGFDDKKFDIVLAQGVFEYVGTYQSQKLAEIEELLNDDGVFITSYVNFGHRDRFIYWPYNNVQSFDDFRASLERHFKTVKFFPTSHNWHHHEPTRPLMKKIQMHINLHIPIVSRRLAVEYFFICSRPRSWRGHRALV